jgi:hypothetical protein
MSVIFTKLPIGGGVSDHGVLTGLLNDDHKQYMLVDGSRGFTSTVSGVTPTQSYHLVTREYADTLSGTGQTNTASNLGSGKGIFYQKIGVDLQFKSLVAGDNIILSVDSGTITISGASGGISDHSFLSNLDYASSGHTGFAPTSHIHDDRYLTEQEITTISGDIVAQIPTDYISDTEIITISGDLQTNIDGKSDVGHTHTESDITDLGDYATTAELTTTSGDIQTQIDNKSTEKVERITLSSGSINDKYIILSNQPTNVDNIVIHVDYGIMGIPNTDYTTSGTQISWAGKGWDGILEVNDILSILYWH